MADSFDLNNQPRAADAMPQIPTSASEVAVRTMASDIDLMGQSGGTMSQAAVAPQSMHVPVTLQPEAPRNDFPTSGNNYGRGIIITIATILAALGLFALGYFVIGK